MKDRDPMAADEVHPLVCVNDINEGSSIDITVSFVDGQNTDERQGQEIMTLDCSLSGGSSDAATADYELEAKRSHLIHVVNAGSNADISMSICTDSASSSDVLANGFLYDE